MLRRHSTYCRHSPILSNANTDKETRTSERFGLSSLLMTIVGAIGATCLILLVSPLQLLDRGSGFLLYSLGMIACIGLVYSAIPFEPLRPFQIAPPKPTSRRFRVVSAAFALSGLAIVHGSYEVFTPAATVVRTAVVLSLFISSGLFMYVMSLPAPDGSELSLKARRALPFGAAGLGMLVCLHLFIVSVPALYTRIAGLSFSEIDTLEVRYHSSRGPSRIFRCGNVYLRGGPMDKTELWKGACFDLPSHARTGSKHLYKLSGKQSRLGKVYIDGSRVAASD